VTACSSGIAGRWTIGHVTIFRAVDQVKYTTLDFPNVAPCKVAFLKAFRGVLRQSGLQPIIISLVDFDIAEDGAFQFVVFAP
jgi:hypothetical protein